MLKVKFRDLTVAEFTLPVHIGAQMWSNGATLLIVHLASDGLATKTINLKDVVGIEGCAL